MNRKTAFYIEISMVVLLFLLNYCYKCIDNNNLISLLIALISLIIAHQTFYLTHDTIESQNEIEKMKLKTEIITDFKLVYEYYIIQKAKRAAERNPDIGDKVKVEEINVDESSLMCRANVMFSNKVYKKIKELDNLIYVFDYRNPWANGTRDQNVLKDFDKCMDIVIKCMVNEVKGEKVDIHELEKEYKEVIENLHIWEKKGE